MRRGTPKADHENVITVYSGPEPWKEHLGVKAEDSTCLVTVETGNVAWLTPVLGSTTLLCTLAAIRLPAIQFVNGVVYPL